MLRSFNKYAIIALFVCNICLCYYIISLKDQIKSTSINSQNNYDSIISNKELLKKLMIDLINENDHIYNLLIYYLQKNLTLDWSKSDTIAFENKDDYPFLITDSFEITSDGSYIINSFFPSKFIALFSKDGQFIRQFGREGKGPGEYTVPSFIDIKKDTIFCYDREQMKIIAYSLSGKFITEYKLFGAELFPKDFKMSPLENKAIFYHICSPFNINNILSIYELKQHFMNLIGKLCKMSNINIPSFIFAINGLSKSENGYIFSINPQEFGFDAFLSDGSQIASFRTKPPTWFKKLNYINNKYLFDQSKLSQLFFKHSRSMSIHYLGKGIIGIYVQNPKKKNEKYIPSYYVFWRVDGKYLGAIKTNHPKSKGKDGILYSWIKRSADSEINYKNPWLIKISLWDSNNL